MEGLGARRIGLSVVRLESLSEGCVWGKEELNCILDTTTHSNNNNNNNLHL